MLRDKSKVNSSNASKPDKSMKFRIWNVILITIEPRVPRTTDVAIIVRNVGSKRAQESNKRHSRI